MASRLPVRHALAAAAVVGVALFDVRRDEEDETKKQGGRNEPSLSWKLHLPCTGFRPSYCDAPKKSGRPLESEYHAVPLPSDDTIKLKDVTTRFKAFASGDLEDVGKFKKEKNGVKIYTVKGGSIPDPTGKTQLPFSRIGEAIIKAPAEDVATLWWVFNSRKDWDPNNTTASEVVEEYGDHTRLVYIKAAAKPLISPRDFVFVAHKVPPSDLGRRLGTYVFVQLNAPTAIADRSGAVRGNINSALVVEPIDAATTRVRYLVEVDPKGWLPAVAVEAAADELPACLGAMKKHLEEQGSEEDERRLVERRAHLNEKDHTHVLLVDSVTASVEDLEALVKMLRQKLDQVKKDERSLGVSLSDLRAKVTEDLRKAEARLREAKGRR